jgi:hypothetical protein
MTPHSRVVIAYHGCRAKTERQRASCEFLSGLLDGRNAVEDWLESENEYDWIGQGIYFWEHGLVRARQWAGTEGVVVGALIQLGKCFDLTDPGYTTALKTTYEALHQLYEEEGTEMPTNQRAAGKLRDLDCLVINQTIMVANDVARDQGSGPYQTVRCAFEEGEEAFPGSMIRTQTHIQIAVRDRGCIIGVFRPNFGSAGDTALDEIL